MPIAIRASQGLNQQGLSRRQLLVRSAATCAVAGLGSLARPYLSRAADRPLIASGIQSGDVSANSAVIWARADRPARMQVECSVVESFKTIIGSATADALPERDFTAKLLVDGLPAPIFFIAYASTTSARAASKARRGSGIFVPHPQSGHRYRSPGRAIRRGRAGASTKTVAGCGLTAPCSTTVRTSSSIPVTTSMRIARWSGN